MHSQKLVKTVPAIPRFLRSHIASSFFFFFFFSYQGSEGRDVCTANQSSFTCDSLGYIITLHGPFTKHRDSASPTETMLWLE